MFQRKKLRKDFDEKLINQIRQSKKEWDHQQEILRLSYEWDEESECRTKLAKSKYLLLLREARARRLSIRN